MKLNSAGVDYADLTEMLFESRERNYGAYALRTNYPKHVMIGLAFVSVIFMAFTFGPLILGEARVTVETERVQEWKMTDIDIPEPPDKKPVVPPPPPPPEPPKVDLAMLANNIPDPTPADFVDDRETLNDIDKLKEVPLIGLEDRDGLMEGDWIFEEGMGDSIPIVIEDLGPGPGDYVAADQEPLPINMGEVAKMVGYPPIAQEVPIEGTVVIRVLVDRKGRYKKHLIVNAVHPILTNAVEAQIDQLKFTPAVQGGKPISFWVNVPFRFKIID